MKFELSNFGAEKFLAITPENDAEVFQIRAIIDKSLALGVDLANFNREKYFGCDADVAPFICFRLK